MTGSEFFEAIKANIHELDFVGYFRKLKAIEGNFDLSKNKTIRIAVLRSFTAESLEPVLKLRLILEGYNPQFYWGTFNQYSQEIFDNASPLYDFKPDLVLLMTRIEELMPAFLNNFGEKPFEDWEGVVESSARHIVSLTETLSKNMTTQIIVQNMNQSPYPYWGIYDAQKASSQTSLVNRFNHILSEAFQEIQTIFIWDFNNLVIRKGYDSIFDPKMWYVSRNPFRQKAYVEIANDLLRYVLSAMGKGKKCIVLDLDNTLWGGVIGEEGFDGIALGHEYPGRCFVDFQTELLKLYNRGIILAINSKNNTDDAFEAIDKHPYMVLRRNHFAAWQINWRDKASNLQELAKEINIGIDSMIMIDDNPGECELIRKLCPECTVIQFPERPYRIYELIRNLPEIDNIRLTDEDKKKGEIYQAQIQRKEFEKVFSGLDDYLNALEVKIEIKGADNFSIPRIAQLTQKTNQFNMTTRRYSESDIIDMKGSSDTFVFSISASDRFGDNGIIGVLVIKFNGETCLIDSFLLSCRVIGRTIEQSILAFVCEFARKKNAKIIIGEFFPTPKNHPAKDVYKKYHFNENNDGHYILNLEKQQVDYSSHIKHSIL
jgi:FkbH-like protein